MASNMRPIGSPQCGNCKFMGDMNGATWCQRFPPKAVVMSNAKGEINTQATFPPVDPGFCWCGEHTPKIVFN